MYTIKEEAVLLWDCWWGSKSDFNLLGKLLFLPITISMSVTLLVLDILFTKKKWS